MLDSIASLISAIGGLLFVALCGLGFMKLNTSKIKAPTIDRKKLDEDLEDVEENVKNSDIDDLVARNNARYGTKRPPE